MSSSQIVINRKIAMKKQGGLCFWCGVEMILFSKVKNQAHSQLCTADHLVTKKEGGGNKLKNIVAACFKCNGARKDNNLETWLVRLKFRLNQSGNPQQFEVVLQSLKSRGIETSFSPLQKDSDPAP